MPCAIARCPDRWSNRVSPPVGPLLIMLVAAFAGYPATMAAYRHAVAAGYRFYSYGDCMLLL